MSAEQTAASKAVTAGIVVIGNEILSGRTLDTNTNTIAKRLAEIGVRLMDVRVVPDIQARIVEAVNECRARYTYVFTTGGIGPTHDDITAEAIAAAFDIPFVRQEQAYAKLVAYYGSEDQVTEARARMAMMPEGTQMIDNPVSGAPGFHLGNVYVMAGVPKIMEAMLDNIIPTLKGGAKIHSEEVSAPIPESRLADDLRAIQAAHEGVDIGSYPHMKDGQLGVSVVVRGEDKQDIAACMIEVKEAMSLREKEYVAGSKI